MKKYAEFGIGNRWLLLTERAKWGGMGVNHMHKVRRAVLQDAIEVAEVWIRARNAAIPLIPAIIHTEEEVKDWMTTIVIPNYETWVAETDHGEIVAMMSLDNGWVEQLYVDPKWNGQGIGSGLIRLAQEQSPNGLQLWTFESNIGARRFYERHGFVVAERKDGSHNEEQAPDIRYQWTLSKRMPIS